MQGHWVPLSKAGGCSKHVAPFVAIEKQSRKSRRAPDLLRVPATTRDQEKALEVDPEQFPFALPKRPKFQPFTGEDERSERMKAYLFTCPVEEGTLVIRPLQEEQLDQAAGLLTESFADAVGYMPMYKGFLRRQVDVYLKSHLNIAPKAIVLEALLCSPDLSISSPEDSGESDGTETCTSWQSSAENRLQDPEGSAQAESSNQAADTEKLSASTMSNIESRPEDFVNPDETFSKFSDQQAKDIANQEEPSTSRNGNFAGLTVNGDDSRPGEEAGRAESLEEGNDPQTLSDNDTIARTTAAGELEGYCPLGEFVGTVELSFRTSTRDPTWTLNPPKDSAYLCNMAVINKHQRKGFGSVMLKAAEEIVRLAGFRRVWLHVRLKDEPARALYERGGFELEKEDCVLVSLFDDRRRLLSKFIPQLPIVQLADLPEEKAPELQTEY